MQHLSLSEKLALSAGHPTGFDYLRIGLAVAVVCMHSFITSYGALADIAMWLSPLRPLIRLILPMFFALSGFLVAGSLLRTTSLLQFLGLRAIRIYPALSVEVLLSALVIGPLLTTLPLSAYFSSPLFGQYLLNVTGHIHYLLPGLFQSNPMPDMVNGQLWTVPYELICYLALTALTIIGVKKYRWMAPTMTAALMAAYVVARLIKHGGDSPFMSGALPGFLLVATFLAGVSIYLYKEKIPWNPWFCLVSGFITAVFLSAVPLSDYIVAPFAAYFTVSLGVTNPKKLHILRGADYSYGIFLYGYVIQQTVVLIFPWAREWWINILLSVPLSAGIAALSWHFVEKPALQLRHYLNPKQPKGQRNAAQTSDIQLASKSA